jgi:predicted aspartyl protease
MNLKLTGKYLKFKANRHRFKHLLFGVIFLAAFCLNIVGFAVFKPTIATTEPPATLAQMLQGQITQKPATSNNLGQELLQQVVGCITGKIADPQQANSESLQAASTQCFMEIVLLNPDGSVRPDASQRLTALVESSGITFPQPASKGQATVQLKQLPNSAVFTIPVQIAGESKTFLLDTGASGSMIDSQTAQKLGLASTPIPNELLKYMVVGNDCSKVQANLHTLPAITVDAAIVEGLSGVGLPKTAIPGNLAGVLGIDFLSSFDVILNPKTMQLQLLPASASVAGAIPLLGRLGNIIAQGQINDRGPFSFVLDTGADLTVISADLAKRLSIDINKAKDVEVTGFCGTQKGKQTQLAKVSLQQHQANAIDTVILDSNLFKLIGVDGIIGQNFLNKYQQHWRFGKRNVMGFAESGSLVLTPIPR